MKAQILPMERSESVKIPRASRRRTPQKGVVGGHSRRQQIFDHAIVLMKEKGLVGTSVQDLADGLEFSKANFYYHIKSKEEMLYRISFETLNMKFEKLKAILNTDDPHPVRMRAVIDCFVHLLVDHTAVISVYFEEKRHLSPAHFKQVAKVERQILDALKDFYREGTERGYFKPLDPAVAMLGILGMCFWLSKWYRPKGRLTADVISAQLQALVDEGCLQPSAR